jgi:hypothetical protein
VKHSEAIKKAILHHITVMKNDHVRSIQEYLITKRLHVSQAEISRIIQQIHIEQRQKLEEKEE